MFHTEVVQETRTYIGCSLNFYFRKSCRLWDNLEKYCRAGQTIKDNMVHAHWMLHNQVCTHTHTRAILHLLPLYCSFGARSLPSVSLRYTYCTSTVLFPAGHSSSGSSASGYGYQSNEKSDKGMVLKDLFELALTALAFKSFGLFILNVILCIYAGVSRTQVIYYFTLE
jgi:hypothetical protein